MQSSTGPRTLLITSPRSPALMRQRLATMSALNEEPLLTTEAVYEHNVSGSSTNLTGATKEANAIVSQTIEAIDKQNTVSLHVATPFITADATAVIVIHNDNEDGDNGATTIVTAAAVGVAAEAEASENRHNRMTSSIEQLLMKPTTSTLQAAISSEVNGAAAEANSAAAAVAAQAQLNASSSGGGGGGSGDGAGAGGNGVGSGIKSTIVRFFFWRTRNADSLFEQLNRFLLLVFIPLLLVVYICLKISFQSVIFVLALFAYPFFFPIDQLGIAKRFSKLMLVIGVLSGISLVAQFIFQMVQLEQSNNASSVSKDILATINTNQNGANDTNANNVTTRRSTMLTSNSSNTATPPATCYFFRDLLDQLGYTRFDERVYVIDVLRIVLPDALLSVACALTYLVCRRVRAQHVRGMRARIYSNHDISNAQDTTFTDHFCPLANCGADNTGAKRDGVERGRNTRVGIGDSSSWSPTDAGGDDDLYYTPEQSSSSSSTDSAGDDTNVKLIGSRITLKHQHQQQQKQEQQFKSLFEAPPQPNQSSTTVAATKSKSSERLLRVYNVLMPLFRQLLFTLLLFACGCLWPSLLSAPYFVAFLILLTKWSLTHRVCALQRYIKLTLLAYLPLHILAYYVYQLKHFHAYIPASALPVRLVGLVNLVRTRCRQPAHFFANVDETHWQQFAYPFMLLSLYWFVAVEFAHDTTKDAAATSKANGFGNGNGVKRVGIRTGRSSVKTAASGTGSRQNQRDGEAGTAVTAAAQRRPLASPGSKIELLVVNSVLNHPDLTSGDVTTMAASTTDYENQTTHLLSATTTIHDERAITFGDVAPATHAELEARHSERQRQAAAVAASARNNRMARASRLAKLKKHQTTVFLRQTRSYFFTIVRMLNKQSYLLSLLSMMSWSILYHSVLTLVLLIWACLIWVIGPNSRSWCLKSSPFYVVYATLLLSLEFAYSLPLSGSELPQYKQIGLVRHARPYLHLSVKSSLLLALWLTLRQYRSELTATNAAAAQAAKGATTNTTTTTSNTFATRNAPSTTTRVAASNSAALAVVKAAAQARKRPRYDSKLVSDIHARVMQWLHILLVKYWIFLSSGTLLLMSCQNQVVTYRIGYMVLFLYFITTFQLTYSFWRRTLDVFHMVVIVYSMIVLLLIYTFQFDGVAAYVKFIFHFDDKMLSSLGFEQFDNKDQLVIRLLTPTTFLIVNILQIHYFNEPWLALTDHEHISSNQHNISSEMGSKSSEDFKNGGGDGRGNDAGGDIVGGGVDGNDKKENFVPFARRKLTVVVQLVDALISYAWRFAEIHIYKLLLIFVASFCFSKVNLLNLLLLCSLLMSMLVTCVDRFSAKVPDVFSGFLQIWASVLTIISMMFKLESIKSPLVFNCTTLTAGSDPYLLQPRDNLVYIGVEKNSEIKDILKHYIGIFTLLALQKIIALRQKHYRCVGIGGGGFSVSPSSATAAEGSKGKEGCGRLGAVRGVKCGETCVTTNLNAAPLVYSTLFQDITYKEMDASIASFFKYVVNFFFYRLGLEVCFVMTTITIIVRMDAYAIIYGLWLGLFLRMRRQLIAKIWLAYLMFLVVLLPVQYIWCLGLPPVLCYEYPWSRSNQLDPYSFLNKIRLWLYLPDYSDPPRSSYLFVDFLQLFFVWLQCAVFRLESDDQLAHHHDHSEASAQKENNNDDDENGQDDNEFDGFGCQCQQMRPRHRTCSRTSGGDECGNFDLSRRRSERVRVSLSIARLGGRNNELVYESLTYKDNPFHDFVSDMRSSLDTLKYAVYFYSYWFVLAMVYLTGTSRISLLCMVYVILSFFFLRYGQTFMMKPLKQLLKQWNVIVFYCFLVIFIKSCLQIALCLLTNKISEKTISILIEIFGVNCRNMPKCPQSRSALLVANINDQNDVSLVWDVICFMVLLLQRRLYMSYMFEHVVNEYRAQSDLADKGADIFKKIIRNKVEMERQKEMEVLKQLRDNVENIRKKQPKAQNQELQTHFEAVRSGDYYMFEKRFEIEDRGIMEHEEKIKRSLRKKQKKLLKQTRNLQQQEKSSEMTGFYTHVSSTTAARNYNIRMEEDNTSERSAATTVTMTTTRRPSRTNTVAENDPGGLNSVDFVLSVEDSVNFNYDQEAAAQAIGSRNRLQQQQQQQQNDNQADEVSRQSWLTVQNTTLLRVHAQLERGFFFVVDVVIAYLNKHSKDFRHVSHILSKKKLIYKKRLLGAPAAATATAKTSAANDKPTDNSEKEQEEKQKIIEASGEVDEKMNAQTRANKFLSSVFYFILSQSEIMCYFFMIVNHLQTASLLSVMLPVSVFLWAMLCIPRPTKTYWTTSITYVEVIVVIKYLFQFKVFPWNQATIHVHGNDIGLSSGSGGRSSLMSSAAATDQQANALGSVVAILGIERKENYFALFDLFVLLAIFFHRNVLKRLGLWRNYLKEDEMLLGENEEDDPSYTDTPNERNVNTTVQTKNSAPVLNPTANKTDYVSASATTSMPAKNQTLRYLLKQHVRTSSQGPPSVGECMVAGGSAAAAASLSAGQCVSQEDNAFTLPYSPSSLLVREQSADQTKQQLDHIQTKLVHKKTSVFKRQRLLYPFIKFYQDMDSKHYAVVTDCYAKLFLCDFVNCIITIFAYQYFGEAARSEAARSEAGERNAITSGVVNSIQDNKVPYLFLVMFLVQFVLMIIDRALYLRKNRRGKFIFQVLLVIFVHAWIFFALPHITKLSFLKNGPTQIWYFVKCIYFGYSSRQIRCGYPSRILGNFLTKSYSYVNLVLFKGFLLVPFLLELRSLMDWMFTDTSLGLSDWLQLEDIYANIFVLKCFRYNEDKYPIPRGTKRNAIMKYGFGGALLGIIIIIIWFPLLLFSFSEGFYRPVPPTECKLDPIYSVSSQQRLSRPFTQENYDELKQSAPDQFYSFINDFRPSDIYCIAIPGISTSVWQISPPSMYHLMRQLGKNDPIDLTFMYTLTRDSSEKQNEQFSEIVIGSKQNKLKNDTKEALHKLLTHKENMKTAEDGAMNQIEIRKAFPKIVHARAKGRILEIDSLSKSNFSYYTDVILSIKNQSNTLWWDVHSVNNSSDYKAPCSRPGFLTLIVFSDKVTPSSLSFLTKQGIVGFYLTFVLALSRIIRIMVVNSSMRIMFEQLPNVDRILKLCRSVYLVRENKKFLLEEELYSKLIFLYRSPETMIHFTKRDCVTYSMNSEGGVGGNNAYTDLISERKKKD